MWVAGLGRLDLSFGGGCLLGRFALIERLERVVLGRPGLGVASAVFKD